MRDSNRFNITITINSAIRNIPESPTIPEALDEQDDGVDLRVGQHPRIAWHADFSTFVPLDDLRTRLEDRLAKIRVVCNRPDNAAGKCALTAIQAFPRRTELG